MPPKPSSSSEGSSWNVRRSSDTDGAQRGKAHQSTSESLSKAAVLAAAASTRNRRPASAPWL